MTLLRSFRTSGFLAAALLFGGCDSGSGNSNGLERGNVAERRVVPERPQPNTNAEELGVLVSIPFDAEDVVWQHDKENGRITAILRFASTDIDKVVEQSAPSVGEDEVSIEVETWFPEELIAQGEMSGDGTLKGKACPANLFLQPPFSNGRVVRIDGADFIYLEVNSN